MHNWFLGSLRYEKMMENGMQKKVTEKYLIDALSCTEAEARLIKEMEPFISGEFKINSVKEENVSEVFTNNDECDNIWFKCKLSFLTLDEKTGNEKRTSTTVMVQAADLRKAVANLDEGMKGTLADYVIDSVADSKIIDVYFYE